jgi:DNA repair protein RecN (Recombination protein N)
VIYPGRDSAEVSSIFRISSAAAECIHQKLGIETDEESTLILRRVYRQDRSNLCYINSVPVRVGDLKWTGTLLVDYLAQNHQLRLQKTEEQLAILDSFAGIENLLSEYTKVFRNFKRLEAEYQEEQKRTDSLNEELNSLSEELTDLNGLQPERHEDEHLKRDIAVYENMASILSSFEHAVDILYENEQSAYDILHAVLNVIGNIEEKPDELKKIEQETTALSDSISAAADSMRRYADSAHFDGRNQDDMKERFYALRKAEDKFGKNLDDLISYWKSLPGIIEKLRERAEHSQSIKAECDACWEQVCSLGKELSAERTNASQRFSAALVRELSSLGLKDCRFKAEVTPQDPTRKTAGNNGFDRAEFLFSANPGIDLRPLRNIASGGELSRIMLGIQSICTSGEYSPLLIFDEIDSEIGGRLGSAVGEKMRSISRSSQVVCITHLPQLASFADKHFRIEKEISGDSTSVTIIPLTDEEKRINELTYMMGQDPAEETGPVSQAKHMLEKAKND